MATVEPDSRINCNVSSNFNGGRSGCTVMTVIPVLPAVVLAVMTATEAVSIIFIVQIITNIVPVAVVMYITHFIPGDNSSCITAVGVTGTPSDAMMVSS